MLNVFHCDKFVWEQENLPHVFLLFHIAHRWAWDMNPDIVYKVLYKQSTRKMASTATNVVCECEFWSEYV